MVSETCPNCTNGRVPGNDWTQPTTPCPECSGPDTIAQRVMAADAAYIASRALPIGDPGRLDAGLALMGLVWETPTLAAAYLDLRAKLDAAKARIAALEAEKLRMYDEHARLVRVGNEEAHKNAAWWRGQLGAVTAQRDELREAGRDAITVMVSVDPMDYSGARRSAIERLRAAVDGAR